MPGPGSHLQPSKSINPVLVCAVAVSLTLNVGLGTALLRTRLLSSPDKAGQPTPVFSDTTTVASRFAPAGLSTQPPLSNSPSPVLWSDLESNDYRQYIRNLRAVGCPEPVIRDLIVAEINQMTAERRRAIWQPPTPAYWQKAENLQPDPWKVKQLMDLEAERSTIIKELLGSDPGPQALIDVVFLQPGTESGLSFLPPAKRQAVLQAFADADLDRKEALLRQSGNVEETLFRERMKALTGVLSPDELNEFRLRFAPQAQSLRLELQFVDCTPAEFQTLLDRREMRMSSDSPASPTSIRHDVQEVLGEERAQEFDRVSNLVYRNARQGLENANLAPELADREAQHIAEILKQAGTLANDATLSVEERRRQLAEIQAQTENWVGQQAGGEAAARAARRVIRREFDRSIEAIRP